MDDYNIVYRTVLEGKGIVLLVVGGYNIASFLFR